MSFRSSLDLLATRFEGAGKVDFMAGLQPAGADPELDRRVIRAAASVCLCGIVARSARDAETQAVWEARLEGLGIMF